MGGSPKGFLGKYLYTFGMSRQAIYAALENLMEDKVDKEPKGKGMVTIKRISFAPGESDLQFILSLNKRYYECA